MPVFLCLPTAAGHRFLELPHVKQSRAQVIFGGDPLQPVLFLRVKTGQVKCSLKKILLASTGQSAKPRRAGRLVVWLIHQPAGESGTRLLTSVNGGLQSLFQKPSRVAHLNLRNRHICPAIGAFPQPERIADDRFGQAGMEGLDLREIQRLAVDENAPPPSERLLPMQRHTLVGMKSSESNKRTHGGEETKECAAIGTGTGLQMRVGIFGAHGHSKRAEAT